MITAWQKLKGLLASDPLLIGQVAVVNANGTVTCTMFDGGSLTVRGAGSVGDHVFIQFGQVQSTFSGLTPISDQDV
jgi:hypothetical protein